MTAIASVQHPILGESRHGKTTLIASLMRHSGQPVDKIPKPLRGNNSSMRFLKVDTIMEGHVAVEAQPMTVIQSGATVDMGNMYDVFRAHGYPIGRIIIVLMLGTEYDTIEDVAGRCTEYGNALANFISHIPTESVEMKKALLHSLLLITTYRVRRGCNADSWEDARECLQKKGPEVARCIKEHIATRLGPEFAEDLKPYSSSVLGDGSVLPLAMYVGGRPNDDEPVMNDYDPLYTGDDVARKNLNAIASDQLDNIITALHHPANIELPKAEFDPNAQLLVHEIILAHSNVGTVKGPIGSVCVCKPKLEVIVQKKSVDSIPKDGAIKYNSYSSVLKEHVDEFFDRENTVTRSHKLRGGIKGIFSMNVEQASKRYSRETRQHTHDKTVIGCVTEVIYLTHQIQVADVLVVLPDIVKLLQKAVDAVQNKNLVEAREHLVDLIRSAPELPWGSLDFGVGTRSLAAFFHQKTDSTETLVQNAEQSAKASVDATYKLFAASGSSQWQQVTAEKMSVHFEQTKTEIRHHERHFLPSTRGGVTIPGLVRSGTVSWSSVIASGDPQQLEKMGLHVLINLNPQIREILQAITRDCEGLVEIVGGNSIQLSNMSICHPGRIVRIAADKSIKLENTFISAGKLILETRERDPASSVEIVQTGTPHTVAWGAGCLGGGHRRVYYSSVPSLMSTSELRISTGSVHTTRAICFANHLIISCDMSLNLDGGMIHTKLGGSIKAQKLNVVVPMIDNSGGGDNPSIVAAGGCHYNIKWSYPISSASVLASSGEPLLIDIPTMPSPDSGLFTHNLTHQILMNPVGSFLNFGQKANGKDRGAIHGNDKSPACHAMFGIRLNSYGGPAPASLITKLEEQKQKHIAYV